MLVEYVLLVGVFMVSCTLDIFATANVIKIIQNVSSLFASFSFYFDSM